MSHFYPRPPRGGRPRIKSFKNLLKNFYPRPPRGGRPPVPVFRLLRLLFLSTPSARRATLVLRDLRTPGSNFYPRPPRGGRPPIRCSCLRRVRYFYPRPPRGGRPGLGRFCCRGFPISIHALREEGDPSRRITRGRPLIFLSTPSARRATSTWRSGRRSSSDFYPRPPRGGRQQKQRQNLYFQTNYTTFCTNLEEP